MTVLARVVLAVAVLLGLALPAAASARTGPVELGTAVNDHGFLHGPAAYRSTLARYDAVTPESAMNIFALQPEEGRWDFSMADQIADWAVARGKRVHGVPLLWCADEWTPRWVLDKAWTRASMEAWIDGYVGTVVRHFGSRVATWDVVNEAFNPDGTTRDCIWSRVLGMDYVERAFRAARAASASATLLYNEYRAENPASRKFLATERLVRDLRGRGVPLDGVGLQFHLFGTGPWQWQVEEAFTRLAALGMQVHISEMDVPMSFLPGPTTAEKLDQQAQAYQTVAAACQAVSACYRLTSWGFTDAYSFRGVENASLPFDVNYAEKPAWRALQRVLRPQAAPVGNRVPSASGRPAVSTTAGDGTLTLTWAPAMDLDKDALTYVVQHRDADDAGWSTVASGVRATSYAFPATQQERMGTWTYRVRASDAVSDGAWSEASVATKVDRVAPAAPRVTADRQAEDAAGGWFRDRVTLSFADGGDPVLPDGSPGSGVDPATLPAAVSRATSGEVTATGTVRDRAQNGSAAGTRTARVDADPPVASLRCPAEPVVRGSAATATWTASDAHSGVPAAEGTVALDTTTAGRHVATAAPADRVGHAVTVTCGFEVVEPTPAPEPTPANEPTPVKEPPPTPTNEPTPTTEPTPTPATEQTPTPATEPTPTRPSDAATTPRTEDAGAATATTTTTTTPAPAPADDDASAASGEARSEDPAPRPEVVTGVPAAEARRPVLPRRVRLDGRRRLRVPVSCPAGAAPCRVRLVLRRGDRRLGTMAATLRPGERRTLIVRLTTAGRRLTRTTTRPVKLGLGDGRTLTVLPPRGRSAR